VRFHNDRDLAVFRFGGVVLQRGIEIAKRPVLFGKPGVTDGKEQVGVRFLEMVRVSREGCSCNAQGEHRGKGRQVAHDGCSSVRRDSIRAYSAVAFFLPSSTNPGSTAAMASARWVLLLNRASSWKRRSRTLFTKSLLAIC